MKIVYMGTPQFAVAPLRSLREAGHDIVSVVTRTDKPAGRGKVLTPPPVKVAAQELVIPVLQFKRLREPESVEELRRLTPDIIVVAAYGQILPKDVLELPHYGCVNIHASLLPAYRGAAPVNWAIIRGERETGVTIMQMDEGLDTGAMLLREAVAVGPADTAGSLLEKLSVLGSRMIVEALAGLAAGKLTPVPQDNAKATLAPLLKKEDGRIDWGRPAAEIHDRVRGLLPWPGAYTHLDGKLVKVLQTEVLDGNVDPGALIEGPQGTLEVGTGKGLLRITSLQPEGKRPMTAPEFLRGHRGAVGRRFDAS